MDAIEILRQTPPHEESPPPWRANGKIIEDRDGYDVGALGYREDAAHIVAAVNAAPVLLAEVDRLRAQLAGAREAVEAWPVPVHTLFCVGWKDPGFDFAGCDCGVDAANATRTAARRALGLEAP